MMQSQNIEYLYYVLKVGDGYYNQPGNPKPGVAPVLADDPLCCVHVVHYFCADGLRTKLLAAGYPAELILVDNQTILKDLK